MAAAKGNGGPQEINKGLDSEGATVTMSRTMRLPASCEPEETSPLCNESSLMRGSMLTLRCSRRSSNRATILKRYKFGDLDVELVTFFPSQFRAEHEERRLCVCESVCLLTKT